MFNGFLFLLATAYEKLIQKVEALRFLRGWIFVVLRKTTGGVDRELQRGSGLGPQENQGARR